VFNVRVEIAMASISSVLPKPRYLESETTQNQSLVTTHLKDEQQQLVKKTYQIPAYGQRKGWRPQGQEDFGDGGAFPEIHVAQYPLEMGKKGRRTNSSNTLALQVNSEGKLDYDVIARQGHSNTRVIQTSFTDLIPLRQRANAGDISLARPSSEEIKSTADRTKAAIDKILTGKVEASKLGAVAKKPNEPTYVRYTPSDAARGGNGRQRIIKMIDVVEDPFAPPKFLHRKVPAGPPSPPPPILRSPPRKLTAKDQEDWYIPPSISNWKNPKGFTIALDKRVAADGRKLADVQVNDNMAKLSEALYAADRSARDEIRQRAAMQQKLAEKENAAKEERLRKLAQQAREERVIAGRGRSPDATAAEREGPRRSVSRSESDEEESVEARRRRQIREERKREAERELRQSRMGVERRVKALARDQNRDISEKVALGVAKPTKATGEAMFDQRLFSQVSTGGLAGGFNQDQVYDRSLFAAQEAVRSIYRPRGGEGAGDDEDEAENEMKRFATEKRFEGLGSGGGALSEPREGPVEFEKDDDPFGVNQMVEDVKHGKRRYGLDDTGDDTKRAKR
jgi:SNW domain-containing protein 1